MSCLGPLLPKLPSRLFAWISVLSSNRNRRILKDWIKSKGRWWSSITVFKCAVCVVSQSFECMRTCTCTCTRQREMGCIKGRGSILCSGDTVWPSWLVSHSAHARSHDVNWGLRMSWTSTTHHKVCPSLPTESMSRTRRHDSSALWCHCYIILSRRGSGMACISYWTWRRSPYAGVMGGVIQPILMHDPNWFLSMGRSSFVED